MHKELKWCAVILAAIVAIASVVPTALKVVPASAAVENVAVADEKSEIAEIAKAQGIGTSESEEVETEVAEPGMISVTVKVDGQTMELMSAKVTVGDMLEAYGIPVGKDDVVTPAQDKVLTEDAEVKVERISFEEITVSEAVPFKTKVEGTDELPAGTKKVVQKGQKGEDSVTYRIKYSDGKEVARKEIARETVKKPVTKIIKKSTVGTINGAEYARKFTVKAYSYTGGGTTASGLPAAVGRIAVDPSVIPLGTRVYVEGYGFATAADTGGNIKGNTIDVYYNSESQCRSWGCRYITIYILK